ncbi:hypothetical protein RRSWK_00958 [Rhodopirellula sp. SWK7]|nr:hypothetical protein RRSWK_00958 [Rhodopirellula sp. SWK7]
MKKVVSVRTFDPRLLTCCRFMTPRFETHADVFVAHKVIEVFA